MEQDKIRNVAIIAHVDHGKTTLVDQLFRQSGLFRSNEAVSERLMDSMDLEKERGITIMAKNGACEYQGYKINIIDTPGHADFGGEVERVLNMADGALFLVDAAEGPMPQSFFVLKKAIARNLPVIVVVNKIDKPAARCEWTVDQVFDLLVKLDAPDTTLDFPIVYASSKEGYAALTPEEKTDNLLVIFDEIIRYFPAPKGDPEGPLQLLVSSLHYNTFQGRLAIGKITSGTIKVGQQVVVAHDQEILSSARILKLFQFTSNQQIETDFAGTGDIVAVAGLPDIRVGQTITDPQNPVPLPSIPIDPPTISMNFLPNDSPFAGKEGDYVTSRHLKDRLNRELLTDVALHVEDLQDSAGFKVSGRGELHLSILIEKMRREGYEFMVSKAAVIMKENDGKTEEPYEQLAIDVDEEHMGRVIEALGMRKGQLMEISQYNEIARLKYKIPTRGLLGYHSQFMTDSKGMGIMNSVFDSYGPYCGEIKHRKNGVLISMEQCTTIAFALFNLQDRGDLFMGPGETVYEGQIIGEHSRDNDLVVNPGKGKKLTNMRASGSDDAVTLTPPRLMSLEQYITYINDDELVELTPKSIRLRKVLLTENARRRAHQA
ncbi:MAG: translational GTPase TypA [Candidatus Margulisiibacteriota bacterium]|jgi:GTP-binding protein